MSKLIGTNGKPISSKQDEPAGEVKCIILFDDVEKFTKSGMIQVSSPKGRMLMPLDKLMQSYLFNIYGMMNHCKIKDIVIHMHDDSSEFSMNKSMKIELGTIDNNMIPNENAEDACEED